MKTWYGWLGIALTLPAGARAAESSAVTKPVPVASAVNTAESPPSTGELYLERQLLAAFDSTDPDFESLLKPVCLDLYRRYDTGDGVPLRPETAAAWLERAIRAGDNDAVAEKILKHPETIEKSGISIFDHAKTTFRKNKAALLRLYAIGAIPGWPVYAENGAVELLTSGTAEECFYAGAALHPVPSVRKPRPVREPREDRNEAPGRLIPKKTPKKEVFRDTGESLLRRASELGMPEASYRLAVFLTGNEKATEETDAEAFDLFKKAADAGITPAMIRLAEAYAEGLGTGKDPEQALRWTEAAAEKGDPGAMKTVALAAYGTLGDEKQIKKASALFEKLAGYGDAQSQFHLGEIYESGYFTSADTEKAFLWYSLAASGGYVRAIKGMNRTEKTLGAAGLPALQEKTAALARKIGSTVPPSPSRGLRGETLAEKCRAGDRAATRIYIGALMNRDSPVGLLRTAREAALRGDPYAQGVLGALSLGGIGVPRDENEARRRLRLAAQGGDGASLVRLAAMPRVESDAAAGDDDGGGDAGLFLLLKSASGSGDSRVLVLLADACLSGTGTAVDEPEGIVFLTRAANLGSCDAQMKLAAAYALGEGAPKDEARAFHWYRQAALQLSGEACMEVGRRLSLGLGAPKSPDAALSWISGAKKIAAKNSPDSGNKNAPAPVSGRTGRFAPKSAPDLRGNPYAIQSPELCIRTAENLAAAKQEGDQSEITELYRRAAELGSAPAMIQYAARLAYGKGVAIDRVSTCAWLIVAGNRGDKSAGAELAARLRQLGDSAGEARRLAARLEREIALRTKTTSPAK